MADQLKPGRELDALVFQKVMDGETRLDFRCPECDGGHFGRDYRDRIPCHDEHGEGCRWEGTDDDAPPAYSTCIKAAWAIVDELGLEVGPAFDAAGKCDGWFAEKPGKIVSHSKAETAPHAICLAALKSVAKNS